MVSVVTRMRESALPSPGFYPEISGFFEADGIFLGFLFLKINLGIFLGFLRTQCSNLEINFTRFLHDT